MLKKTFITIILILLGYSIYVKQTPTDFQHNFSESQLKRTIDIEWFKTNKQGLLNRIEKSKNNEVDSFTQKHRNYLQLTRCNSLLNTVDKSNNSTANIKQAIKNHHLVDNRYFNQLKNEQKAALTEYLDHCLSLLLPDKTYNQTQQMLSTFINDEEPSNQNGKDLKQVLETIKIVSNKQQVYRNLIQQINKQLKQRNLTTREKSILKKENNRHKEAIRAIYKSYQEAFRLMLLTSQSPDVAYLILYQYKNRLPEYWYKKLIQKLSGLPNKELNEYVQNKYFDYLIHPAIDLYICSLGYPCDKHAYLMYFQCLGMRYKANLSACNKPVYQYYLSDFLTENMQYDILKLQPYFRGYET